MPGGSSNVAVWSTLLESASSPVNLVVRPDDPRLGEATSHWDGDLAAFTPGRAVLIGFPQDEGVRRNHGRPGAALAPGEIRRWLARLTTGDPSTGIDLASFPPLDAGDLRLQGALENSQQCLAEVVSHVLHHGAIPIIMGGGHETAYGHYLAYTRIGRRVGIINIDAHLDLRPVGPEGCHSGTPFRQAMEHATHPLSGDHYVVLGVQPHATSRYHWEYALNNGCILRCRADLQPTVLPHFAEQLNRLKALGCQAYVTLDADAVQSADVPSVSAPNCSGLPGIDILPCARLAGQTPWVNSFDLVEINPLFDIDGRGARWAALVIWNFLIGLASRTVNSPYTGVH